MALRLFLLSLLMLGCTNTKNNAPILVNQETFHLAEDWVKNQGLLNVESVIHDKSNHCFYTTSGNQYKVGGEGYISKISAQGELLQLKWVDGLNRPTGMALHNGQLYVADVNALVVIDPKNGHIIQRIMAPSDKLGLNDVSINSKGDLFVTASFVHSVYTLIDDELRLWLQDEELLQWANGIVAEDKHIIVGGTHLISIDIATKEVTPIQLPEGADDFDGISPDGSGGYFLTTVTHRSLLHLDADLKIQTLQKSDSIYFGDTYFSIKDRTLFVPRGFSARKDFYISVFKLTS